MTDARNIADELCSGVRRSGSIAWVDVLPDDLREIALELRERVQAESLQHYAVAARFRELMFERKLSTVPSRCVIARWLIDDRKSNH